MHHGYVGLGKRESKTSTKWSARNPPPSLGSHDWLLLARFPCCFRILEFSDIEGDVAALELYYICCTSFPGLLKLCSIKGVVESQLVQRDWILEFLPKRERPDQPGEGSVHTKETMTWNNRRNVVFPQTSNVMFKVYSSLK